MIAPSAASPSTTEALLASLDTDTDLSRLVKRVSAERMRWVVVSTAALTAWQRRDPEGWAKVAEWLDASQVAIVRV